MNCVWQCRSSHTQVWGQIQADPWEYSLSSQSDDLRWQESNLQFKLLLEHIRDTREVEHTQRLLCASFNVTLTHTHAETLKTCQVPEDFLKSDATKSWTHCGRDDHRPARPYISSFLTLLQLFLLLYIWLVIYFQSPFFLICCGLHIRVKYTEFKAHFASIPQGNLSFSFMIKQLKDRVNEKEVTQKGPNTKLFC